MLGSTLRTVRSRVATASSRGGRDDRRSARHIVPTNSCRGVVVRGSPHDHDALRDARHAYGGRVRASPSVLGAALVPGARLRCARLARLPSAITPRPEWNCSSLTSTPRATSTGHAAAPPRARRRAQAAPRPRCARCGAISSPVTVRAARCSCASASSAHARSRHGFLELSPLAAHGLYDGDARAPGCHPRVVAPQVCGRQRRHCEGALNYPMTVQKTSGPGDRARESAAWLTWSIPAAPPAAAGRGVPDRDHSVDLLQPGAHVGAADSPARRRHGLVTRWRVRPAMSDEAVSQDRGRASCPAAVVRAATGEEVTPRTGRRRPSTPAFGRGRPPRRGRRARARDRARHLTHLGRASARRLALRSRASAYDPTEIYGLLPRTCGRLRRARADPPGSSTARASTS